MSPGGVDRRAAADADKAGLTVQTTGVEDDAQGDPETPSAKFIRNGTTKIRVGVCCVQKKLASRPMREILKFLARNEEIEICPFNDAMLLEAPIEEWLRCDVLIGFYSTGFPL